MSYVPAELRDEWAQRDPIDRYRTALVDIYGFPPDEVEGVLIQVADEVAAAAEVALASPMPEQEVAFDGVYAEQFEPLGDGRAPWSRYAEAHS
jgi:TPP-dependent pyruvate/acetoin dehydrogenase alpha subunit